MRVLTTLLLAVSSLLALSLPVAAAASPAQEQANDPCTELMDDWNALMQIIQNNACRMVELEADLEDALELLDRLSTDPNATTAEIEAARRRVEQIMDRIDALEQAQANNVAYAGLLMHRMAQAGCEVDFVELSLELLEAQRCQN